MYQERKVSQYPLIESENTIHSKCFHPSPLCITSQRTFKDETFKITETIYLQDNMTFLIVR